MAFLVLRSVPLLVVFATAESGVAGAFFACGGSALACGLGVGWWGWEGSRIGLLVARLCSD